MLCLVLLVFSVDFSVQAWVIVVILVAVGVDLVVDSLRFTGGSRQSGAVVPREDGGSFAVVAQNAN
ncbi:Uncharacterised protein [Dermatophilus congolensis]|uniref:Uncharacterized protein n=1 Tax=Dermatophilus congolensis TaxID=1863 RepID=A0AA46BP66_9MICO|nr:Uncharacterised protein [Dermatophilus congolensis]